MATESSERTPPISREDSFFSLDSGNSAYVTARESLTTSAENVGRVNPSERISGENGLASINTSRSSSTVGDDSLVSDFQDIMSTGQESPPINDEGDGEVEFELKDDVSKICNDIAENIQPNNTKKTAIAFEITANSSSSRTELQRLAVADGGLLSNALRRGSWPVLLGISEADISTLQKTKIPMDGTNVSREIKNLVRMDVARVLKRFPPGLSDPQQDHLQIHLSKLIIAVLEKNPQAYYYQGFHDISLTFLLVCASQGAPFIAYLGLNKMINTLLAPFMEETMDATHDLIHVLFAIIEKEDGALFKKIVEDSKCPAAFCLPWVLTWFSHTLPNDSDVFRVYDFMLGASDEVNPPYLVPIFVSAALVLRNAGKIKAIRETDIATIHHALAMLPSQLESLEPWLRDSILLMRKYTGNVPELLRRATEIKDFQNKLWDVDNVRRKSSGGSRSAGLVTTIGRYIFVKHRWYSLAVIILGTAFLLQAKYGSSNIQPPFLKTIQKYLPESVKIFYSNHLAGFEFEGF